MNKDPHSTNDQTALPAKGGFRHIPLLNTHQLGSGPSSHSPNNVGLTTSSSPTKVSVKRFGAQQHEQTSFDKRGKADGDKAFFPNPNQSRKDAYQDYTMGFSPSKKRYNTMVAAELNSS
jgi:hypothetical protein